MAEQGSISITVNEKLSARNIVRLCLWFCEHWLLVFTALFGVFMVAPFLAPLFMRLGWTGAAHGIYTLYSYFCHQMAQRCFFLFGAQPMYNAAQLPLTLTGNMDTDMLALRAFTGNASVGWKVAWSDRMVYMYSTVWLAGIVYGLVRRRWRVRPLRVIEFGLLLLPMGIDGGTHMVSDMLNGLTSGFRYDNQWLAVLTGNSLPHWFYYGDAFGSINSWLRLFTGVCFGLAVVGLAFPYLDQSMPEAAAILRDKLVRARAREIAV